MKKITIEIKWAFIFILLTLLWVFLEKLFGLHDKYIHLHPVFTNLFAIPAVLIFVFALREKREKVFNQNMSWKKGFLSGLILSLFITVLSPFAQLLISNFISPEFSSNAIEYAVTTGKTTVEEAKKYFSQLNYITNATLGAFVMGVITSAIVSIFLRNKSAS